MLSYLDASFLSNTGDLNGVGNIYRNIENKTVDKWRERKERSQTDVADCMPLCLKNSDIGRTNNFEYFGCDPRWW